MIIAKTRKDTNVHFSNLVRLVVIPAAKWNLLLLKQQAEKLVPNIEHVKEEEPKKRGGKSAPKERKVLVFDEEGKLEAVMRSLKDVASMTNLREKAIDRLCKTKRVSSETGYSFRYWWKVLGFDITDFTLTASQYDELCKRKSD